MATKKTVKKVAAEKVKTAKKAAPAKVEKTKLDLSDPKFLQVKRSVSKKVYDQYLARLTTA